VQGCAAGSGADTINFSVSGTISLATEIVVDSDVTISGPGAASLTIAPSGTNRAFYINDYNPTVTISGVTFQGNGTSTVYGAALYNYGGALTIQNCVFSGNVATGDGGAIYLYGSGALTMSGSTLTGNQAVNGGAIRFYSAAASTITNSTISGNTAQNGGGSTCTIKR
jgi:predicted outer membrane repeat protein